MSAARALAIAVSVGLALTVGGCAPGPGSPPPPSPGDIVAEPTAAPPEPSAAPPAPVPSEPAPPAEVPTVTGQPTSHPPEPSATAPTPPVTPTPTPPAPAPSSTPPASPPPGLLATWRGIDLERIPTQQRVVALTFDGGGSAAGVSSILATLEREGVPATFFVTGQFARAFPQQVRAMADAGHPVGNHSDTHPAFPDIPDTTIAAELARAEAAILDAAGQPARPLFRFPFGATTPYDVGVVNDLGYVPIRWSVDSLGWLGTSRGGSAAAVADRVVAAAEPGMIALMHVGANPDDGTTFDADALPAIIERLRAAGYGFVDLGDVVR